MIPLVKIPRNIWPELKNLYSFEWPNKAPAYCLFDTQLNNAKLSEIFNFEKARRFIDMIPLVKIPRNIWPELKNLYSFEWPNKAPAYCLFDTQLNNAKLSEIFNFEVYCPFGDINNGVEAFTNKVGFNQVFILPVNDTEKIKEALITTNLIDSGKDNMIPIACADVVDCLVRVSKDIGIYVNADVKAIRHFLSNNTALFDISLPPNTYISSLKQDHIEIVNETWPYRDKSTRKFFEALMENDMTYVLYSLDGEPMAWITVSEAGVLTHLYCVEAFRRRGYAEIVTKFACNDLLKKGRHVITYIVEENEKSQKLLHKLGFVITGYDYWIHVGKL